jgi:hypothetical protein
MYVQMSDMYMQRTPKSDSVDAIEATTRPVHIPDRQAHVAINASMRPTVDRVPKVAKAHLFRP